MASKGLCHRKSQEGRIVLDTSNAPQAIFECYHTIPPTFPSDNLNQNTTPECQEVCHIASNAVINYIGQILLEEDINDDINIYEEEAAIRETEKSFYDLLGKEYPPSPTLIEFHPPQNDNITSCGSSNTIESVLENDMPTPSNLRPLLTSAERTSNLFMEYPFIQVQMGAEEARKFLPAVEKLFVGLEPNTIDFHEEPQANNVSKNKDICYETGTKKSTHNNRELDLSEVRASKQHAFSLDEPARNENLDQFLFSCGSEYEQAFISAREIAKKEMINESQEHQVDIRSKKALGKKKTGYDMVNLHSLLIHCSEVVSANNYYRASELIKQIEKYSSPVGDCDQRVAHYLVDALKARLAGAGSDIYRDELLSSQMSLTDYLKVFRIYYTICPFLRASYYFSNQTVLNVSKNATNVHIIDFGINMGFLWPSFFERLSSLTSSPPKIRITGVEFPQKGFRPRKQVEETGRRLLEYAQRFNIRLKYQGIATNWENIRIEDLKIETDEILVVNCLYRLEKLADETISINCARDKFLSMIREIKPCVFIQGILNGLYSTPFYTTRFKEVLSKLSSFFDIFESNMPRESEVRQYMERSYLSPIAINAIAFEGSERVERPETCRQWQARNIRAGFVQLPVDSLIKKYIKRSVRELYHKEFVVDEDNKWLLLGWRGTILFGLSTWKPNEY